MFFFLLLLRSLVKMDNDNNNESIINSKNLKPDEYTKGLDQEHIIKLTEDACKHFVEYTKAELKGKVLLFIDCC